MDELAFQLKDSGAKALVTQKAHLKNAIEAAKRVGIEEDKIILMGDERDETARFKHFTNIRNISGASRYRRTKINPKKDLAFLVYSSGTTGHPKGVMLSHENIVANTLMINNGEGPNLNWNGGKDGQGDRILAFLPFFHIYVCLFSFHESKADNIGTHLSDTPISLLWYPARRHAKIRSRAILSNRRKLQNHLRIRRPSRHSPARQIARRQQIRSLYHTNDKFRCRTLDERSRRNNLQTSPNSHKTRLWALRNLTYNTYPTLERLGYHHRVRGHPPSKSNS